MTEETKKLLSNNCPIKPKNTTEKPSLDFGIFQDAHESGVLSSDDFLKRLAHCFWWGLRNLRWLTTYISTKPFSCIYIYLSWYIFYYKNEFLYVINRIFGMQFSGSKPQNKQLFLGKRVCNFYLYSWVAPTLVSHWKLAGWCWWSKFSFCICSSPCGLVFNW